MDHTLTVVSEEQETTVLHERSMFQRTAKCNTATEKEGLQASTCLVGAENNVIDPICVMLKRTHALVTSLAKRIPTL